MSHLIIPASPGEVSKAGWSVCVDGDSVLARIIRIEHGRFGTLSFGRRPEGTIGWGWQEVGGGGVGIVPWAILNGKLHIGLIRQDRHFMQGTPVRNIPRGFLDPGKTHFETAAQEFEDEVGWKEPQLRLELLGGQPANFNSTFHDTTAGGGFQYFGFKVLPSEIERKDDEVRFKPGLVKPLSTMAERILGCSFVPWEMAAQIADNFSNAGVARLLASKPDLHKYL